MMKHDVETLNDGLSEQRRKPADSHSSIVPLDLKSIC